MHQDTCTETKSTKENLHDFWARQTEQSSSTLQS